MEPPPPPGLLILGGQSTKGPLSSVETFGFENCSIPSLPEFRYGFGSFIAPTDPPQLAACGGWWKGKPNSTDCVTLNSTSSQWERGMFSNGLLGDGVIGVINMDGEGVFMVHKTGISFLAPGSESWVAGPLFATFAVCGCNLSSASFVIIHRSGTHKVREYSVTNGKAEPEPTELWPDLLKARNGPGCAATAQHLIVAGGVSDSDEILASVEVFDIESKALRRGGKLRQARSYFQIIPVGSTNPRLLAIGGQSGNSFLDSTEWWEEEEDSWEAGPTLSTGRSNFAALMAPDHLVCSEMIRTPDQSSPVVPTLTVESVATG